MADQERPTFVVHLQPTPDCTNPIGALRELLKRALRSWGLRCITLKEIPHQNSVPESTDKLSGIVPALNYGPRRADTL
jgi:hypothetical protein